ncbi:hypothetical protein ACRALDRAFT_205472 [Sodiomyces alcalophilus JCM 7366]|uniref:uncharacterized protein n=1 Tax=Sodiomyces alcalophilus JCM 7366 TaxID=591952 RepID=UPI0039B54F7C
MPSHTMATIEGILQVGDLNSRPTDPLIPSFNSFPPSIRTAELRKLQLEVFVRSYSVPTRRHKRKWAGDLIGGDVKSRVTFRSPTQGLDYQNIFCKALVRLIDLGTFPFVYVVLMVVLPSAGPHLHYLRYHGPIIQEAVVVVPCAETSLEIDDRNTQQTSTFQEIGKT